MSGQERVVALALAEPDAKNPLPIVLAKDGVVVLSYMAFIALKDQHIIVSFHTAYEHRFGPPPARAPKAPGGYEVERSAWVRESFGGKGRHYLFVFPDGVFECVADGFGAETVAENEDAVRLMSRRLYK
ncbi:MAG: hypothetical protein SF051_01000 [Elusimicrobiota bacterium]|nr:hypothetical protein [Elusimicrobiota bacterium]